MITKELRALKEKSNLTNHQIAEISGIPESTIARVLAGQTDNPSFATISAMVVAMGGSLDTLMDKTQKVSEEKTKREEIDDRLIELYKETIAHKDMWIRRLFFALSILMIFILVAFIFDISTPGIGYVRF